MFGFLATAVAIAQVLQVAHAQTTDVTSCVANHTYLTNSKGQNPCLVAAYLEAPCTSVGDWNVNTLVNGEAYFGPDADQANYCSCSSVVYSLTSACAACQGDFWIGWSDWSVNCTANVTTVGSWPLDIPAATEVPAWAYQNVTITDTWNVTLAALNTAPQSTYFGTPTATVVLHSSASNSPNPTSTTATTNSVGGIPAPTAGSTSSGTKTPVGAIVGGVVGGVVVLALLALLLYLIFFRGKKDHAPSALPLVDQKSDGMYMAETESSLPAGYGVGYPSPTSLGTAQRLYDPSDPSTFPGRNDTPASFGIPSNQTAISHSAMTSTSYPLSSPTVGSSGRYTGAAEV